MEAYSDDWLRYIMPGMELFVDRIGEGRPLVFLHGNPVDHRIHLPMDGAIAQVGGWERWYLDLPGFGRSPLPDNVTSSQTMAEALVTWLVSTLRDKPFALVGSSFGGLMARYVANHMPNQVSGLGLICPLVTADRAKRRLPPFRLAQVDQDLAAKVPAADWAEYAEMAVIQSPQGWEGFRRYILPALRADSAAVVGRLARSYDLTQPPEMVGASFNQPALILCGRDDNVVGFEDQFGLLGHYSSATYVALANCGHNAWNDQPHQVESHLVQLLERIPAT